MSLYEEIKRAVWHEMGHLCIDIIKPTHHIDYAVKEFCIKYRQRRDDLPSWGGFVKMLPSIKYLEIPKDSSFMAYSLMSLCGGCIFETRHLGGDLKDCFGQDLKSVGSGDWRAYKGIVSTSSRIHPYFRGNKEVFQFIEFDYVKLVQDEILKLTYFFKELEKIVNKISSEIEKDFSSKGKPSPYSLLIDNEKLEKLITEAAEISEKYGFTETISALRERFMEEYESFIEKYKDPKPESD
ncbi:hypothetical protein MTsPCn5_28770 [Croceitalea sp. MTPC5]|uniref:hypothetical protein n=1 Tax=Croceitalea sp. MTPC5 TaxID=3056565 RepID=UPI002B39AE29|nr:hypothetical protein MTsPCn5_28770 [Croceitalea sp. MTPC5]